MSRRQAILLSIGLAACQAVPAPSLAPGAPTTPVTPAPTSAPMTSPSAPPTPPLVTAAPTTPPLSVGGIYAATVEPVVAERFTDVPPRVWVPNERGGRIVVIDPATFEIVDRFEVGTYPEHVTPAWDGSVLYVNNMNSNDMSVIDPRTGDVTGRIETPFPYNLYFTPDGTRAIVVQDMERGAPDDENGIRFYAWPEFRELAFVPVPWAGADHLDFSADGRTIYLSCEYSGRVAVIDVESMRITGDIAVGGYPTDVRLAPDGRRLFVANQQLHGVTVIDTETNAILAFVKLERGSHGLALSRDASLLFVTNRMAGSLSAIDVETLDVVGTWKIGGSPDMLAVSTNGQQIWISNRWHRTVVVVDSGTGRVLRSIEVGAWPHGLSYWPLPGRYSLGHNGNMR